MKTTLEIEVKSGITEEDYEQLIIKYGLKNEIFKQTNYYFDTEKLDLTKQNIVLRIRQKGDNFKLTSKTHEQIGTIENHIYLEKAQAFNMLENGFDANLINLPFIVKNIAKLDTYRVKMPYKEGFLFFDKSVYQDNTDYEVEYESNDKKIGKEIFLNFLNENKIEYKKLISKSKRAILANKK